jgi:hypothetical protein
MERRAEVPIMRSCGAADGGRDRIRGSAQTRVQRHAAAQSQEDRGLRMVVTEDGIRFVQRELGEPSLELVGLVFFRDCLGRVAETFLSASDSVLTMKSELRPAGRPEAAPLPQRKGMASNSARWRRPFTPRDTDRSTGEQSTG